MLTFDAIAEQYPDEKFILLMPQVSRHLLTSVPMWSLDVATVKVDPNNEKEAYEVGWKTGEFALTKVSLDALATAADLTVLAKRVDDKRDKDYAEYEGHAIMTTPSGGVRRQGRTCDWIAEVELEKVTAQANRWVDMGIENRWNGFSAATREQKLNSRIAERWLSAREFGKRGVESKAANRAVRALLGISPKYSFDELNDKKFAVVRFVFTPDLDDREVKLMVISAGLQAQRMMYGAPAQIEQPTTLPPVNIEPLMLPPEQAAAVQELAADVEEAEEVEAEEVTSGDWAEAVELISDVMVRIEGVENKSTQTKLRKRLSKAIGNTDAGQVNAILDYLLSKEGSK